MRYLTEREAWELAGEYFSLPKKDKIAELYKLYPRSYFSCWGLCTYLKVLYDNLIISEKTYDKMINLIMWFVEDAPYWVNWLCPPNEYYEPDYLRAMFCYLMAEACEDM